MSESRNDEAPAVEGRGFREGTFEGCYSVGSGPQSGFWQPRFTRVSIGPTTGVAAVWIRTVVGMKVMEGE